MSHSQSYLHAAINCRGLQLQGRAVLGAAAASLPFVRDRYLRVVGLDGAKWEILGRRLHCKTVSFRGGMVCLGSSRACTCMSHMRLKRDDLPTLGRPTIPILRLLFTRPKRLADF